MTTTPKTLADLATPAFVVNKAALAENCERVRDFASRKNWRLRPHLKTHKTAEGAKLQVLGTDGTGSSKQALSTGFVASTLPEVALLVQAAISCSAQDEPPQLSAMGNVLYGVPISSAIIRGLLALRDKLLAETKWREDASPRITKQTIHILMDHPTQVGMVEEILQQQNAALPFSVFVKLDTGYHRAGIPCDERGVDLVDRIIASPHLTWAGLYSHCGHSYDIADGAEIDKIANTDMNCIQTFLVQLQAHWNNDKVQQRFAHLTISVGSTPSLFHHKQPSTATTDDDNQQQQHDWWSDFCRGHPTVIFELHPGNYTLFDRQQLYSKACPSEKNIAGRVMTRVIGHYPDRNTILLDAGATALTKEPTPQGDMAAISGRSADLEVYKMSQEVSVVRRRRTDKTADDVNGAEKPFPFDEFPLGGMTSLLPNHSCLSAACFEKYYIIDDPMATFATDTPIVDVWIPCKGW